MAAAAKAEIRRTALVTGASDGIGAELARLFARDGWNVVLVARSRDGLEKVGRGLADAFGVAVPRGPRRPAKMAQERV